MDAKQFIRQYDRMCKTNTMCYECPANRVCEGRAILSEKLVDCVEKWAELHPYTSNRNIIKTTFGNIRPSSHPFINSPSDIANYSINNIIEIRLVFKDKSTKEVVLDDEWLDKEYNQPKEEDT